MFLIPEQYDSASVYDLLDAASRGRIGIDRRLLRSITSRGDGAVPDLLRFAAENRLDRPVDIDQDLIALFRHFGTRQAIPFYIEYLRRNPSEVPDMLFEAMSLAGQEALEPLLNLYNGLEEEQSGEIAFLLAGLGVKDDRIRDILASRLEYDPWDTSISMECYCDPALIPDLQKLAAELTDRDKDLKQVLQLAARHIETESAAPSEVIASPAFDIYAEYPETAPPDFDVLDRPERVSMLDAPSPELRAQAAVSLGDEEHPHDLRERLLHMAKTDDDMGVRAGAWIALAPDADHRDEIRAELIAAFTNESGDLRERAGAALSFSSVDPDSEELKAVLPVLYEQDGIRATVLKSMWHTFDRRFAEYFPKNLDNADEEVRSQAILGIGYLGITAEAPRLERFFEHEELRPVALIAYALAGPTELSRGRMQRFLRKIEDIAGGLSEDEQEVVEDAIDQRLAMHGLKPVFAAQNEDGHEQNHSHHHHDRGQDTPKGGHEHHGHHHHDPEPSQAPQQGAKPGRNDPCPCGSGRKYKKCCGAKQG